MANNSRICCSRLSFVGITINIRLVDTFLRKVSVWGKVNLRFAIFLERLTLR